MPATVCRASSVRQASSAWRMDWEMMQLRK